jgi:hypothetical protein
MLFVTKDVACPERTRTQLRVGLIDGCSERYLHKRVGVHDRRGKQQFAKCVGSDTPMRFPNDQIGVDSGDFDSLFAPIHLTDGQKVDQSNR